MNHLGNLRPSSRTPGPDARVPAAGAPARGPADEGTAGLRQSDTSFFSRVKRWFGIGGAHPAAPLPLLDSLRPPATGRLGFFFGRLSRLSDEQFNKADKAHADLIRAPARAEQQRPREELWIPDALRTCLQGQSRKKPEEIFDAVCGLWTGASASQAPALQREVLAFLRTQGTHQLALAALKQALRAAHAGQGSAQLEARARAVYAALVGSASHHASQTVASPLEDSTRQIDELARSAKSEDTLLERARILAGIEVGLGRLALEGDQALGLAQLQARCLDLRRAQQQEIKGYLDSHRTAFTGTALAAAVGQVETHRKALDTLREAMDSSRDWPDPVLRQACDAQVAGLNLELDAVAHSVTLLERYDAIKRLDWQGHTLHKPCAALTGHLRQGKVAAYCEAQRQIDQICALADPSDQLDLMAALGEGLITGKDKETGRDRIGLGLLGDLLDGTPDAVDKILAGAQWDEVAGALRLAGVAAREQVALAKAADDQTRDDAIAAYGKQRFTAEVLQKRRVLNTQVNRLLARKDPTQAGELLGPTGSMTGANPEAIQKIKSVGGDLGREVDVLLVNWIYCSCLDPRTQAIDLAKAESLWKELKGPSARLPRMAQAQALLAQGFRSFASVDDVHKQIHAFSRFLADAELLGKASHDQDPRVLARGLVSELHERLTGRKGIDPADEEFTRLLKDRVDAARQAWIDAIAPEAAKRVREIDKRNAAHAALEAGGWKITLDADGQLATRIAEAGLPQRDQLQRVVDCLVVVAYIDEQAAQRTAAGNQQVTGMFDAQFLALAAQLRHFDPKERRFRAAAGAEPTLGQMRALLKDKDTLQALLNADRSVAATAKASPKNSASTTELAQLSEGIARIAVLQEAIATQGAPAPGAQVQAADGVLRRFAQYGVGVADPIPALSATAKGLWQQVHDKQLEMDITSLCRRFDPEDLNAKGALRQDIPGTPAIPPGGRGLMGRARAYLQAPEARRRLNNQHAVAQRFATLEAGQSFDIHLGRRGELSVGYPVVPGVSVSAGVIVGLGNGIRISRTGEEAYEVDVASTKSAALSGMLSALGGALAGSAQRSADATRGYRITCASQAEALELVEALIGQRALKPEAWSSGQVRAMEVRTQERRGGVQLAVALNLPGDQALFKFEAEVDKSSGTQLEVTQSPFIRTERRTQVRAWQASARADVLDGRLSGEAERGARVSVTRTCDRDTDGLVRRPGLAVRARVVGDDVKGALLRAMPHLAGEELDHFVQQVEQARADSGQEGQAADIELQCAMTPEGVDRANDWYRQAHRLLGAKRPEGTRTASAVMGLLREADHAMRDPSHYVIQGVDLVLQASADAVADGEALVKETARVAFEQRLSLAMPASGGGRARKLSDHTGYGALLAGPAS